MSNGELTKEYHNALIDSNKKCARLQAENEELRKRVIDLQSQIDDKDTF